MRARGPVYAPPGAPLVKNDFGQMVHEYWRKRGGPGKSGSGPSGWKLKPSRVLSRAMAEMASQYRSRKKAST